MATILEHAIKLADTFPNGGPVYLSKMAELFWPNADWLNYRVNRHNGGARRGARCAFANAGFDGRRAWRRSKDRFFQKTSIQQIGTLIMPTAAQQLMALFEQCRDSQGKFQEQQILAALASAYREGFDACRMKVPVITMDNCAIRLPKFPIDEARVAARVEEIKR